MSNQEHRDGINTEKTTNDDVRDYYSQCHSIYHEKWSEDSDRESIHYGYFDEETDTLGEAVHRMKSKLADSVDLDPNDRVLDCSGGYGDNATWQAKERGADVVGLNISPLQISYARELAKERGVKDQVEFREDDFTKMETIEDNSFDVVWGLESICYADNKREFLEQAKRVLKDDGRIVVTDWYMEKRDLSWVEDFMVKQWLKGWRLNNYAHLEDFQNDLADLGFENITSEKAEQNIMKSARDIFLFSLWGYPLGKLLNFFGRRNDTELANAVACFYQYPALKSDAVTYSIISAEL
jgi:cyclopropane fatty-acyl-phospholipid synthase-like methyltransferase